MSVTVALHVGSPLHSHMGPAYYIENTSETR